MHRLLVAALAAILVTFAATGADAATGAADSELAFTVMRDGDEIGYHQISMTTHGGQTKVDIETEVAVKLAFITVYNFDHEGHEVWENGHLVSYSSRTDDDGTDKSMRASIDGNDLVVDGSAAKSRVDASIVPASLWNLATVSQTKLLNTLDGSVMTVAINALGVETLDSGGRKVEARHYAMTGDLERELWYDDHGQLVKVKFLGSDGSQIEYILK